MPNKKFIGIDLGTTYSAMATLDQTGRAMIIPNSDGEHLTASVITIQDDGEIVVGTVPNQILGIDPNTIGRFKRSMDLPKLTFPSGRKISPMELSSYVLSRLKRDFIQTEGEIAEAVVTVPANFTNDAREATMSAAKAAGLPIKYIINEPTAAALYYASKKESLSGTYAVYDFGGGTFDCSIVQINGRNVETICSVGVAQLGGDDFDQCLIDLFAKKYKDKTGQKMKSEFYSRFKAETDKKNLSKMSSASQMIGEELIQVSRTEFEEAINPYIAQAEMLCIQAISEMAGKEIVGLKQVEDINGVLLVGGSTRVPSVRASIQKIFKKEPLSEVNVDEAVALGAAIYAAIKGDPNYLSPIQRDALKGIQFADVCPAYLGVEALIGESNAIGNSIIIKKNTKLPCSVVEDYLTLSDNQRVAQCKVTQCSSPETDIQFCNILADEPLKLSGHSPAGTTIKITYSYDVNGTVHCSFVEVGYGKSLEIVIDATGNNSKNTSPTDSSSAGGLSDFVIE